MRSVSKTKFAQSNDRKSGQEIHWTLHHWCAFHQLGYQAATKLPSSGLSKLLVSSGLLLSLLVLSCHCWYLLVSSYLFWSLFCPCCSLLFSSGLFWSLPVSSDLKSHGGTQATPCVPFLPTLRVLLALLCRAGATPCVPCLSRLPALQGLHQQGCLHPACPSCPRYLSCLPCSALPGLHPACPSCPGYLSCWPCSAGEACCGCVH